MENSVIVHEPLWLQQQRADKAKTTMENRDWLKRFVLAVGLIVLTLLIATVIARP